jgi:hypothetical protein
VKEILTNERVDTKQESGQVRYHSTTEYIVKLNGLGLSGLQVLKKILDTNSSQGKWLALINKSMRIGQFH